MKPSQQDSFVSASSFISDSDRSSKDEKDLQQVKEVSELSSHKDTVKSSRPVKVDFVDVPSEPQVISSAKLSLIKPVGQTDDKIMKDQAKNVVFVSKTQDLSSFKIKEQPDSREPSLQRSSVEKPN